MLVRVFRPRSGLLALFVCGVVGLSAQEGKNVEWRSYASDLASTFYSPSDQITSDNFNELEIAWRFSTRNLGPTPEANLQSTPLMVGGLVYASTALGQVAAVDAGTGALVWSYDPQTYDRLDRPAHMGWQHRGVTIPQANESRW